MSEKFLRADGLVELRPDPAKVADAARNRVGLITTGELCTACLVGDWGQSLLKVTKTLCDDCTWLESEVSRRAGTGRSRAGRPGPGRLRAGGASDPGDAAWASIRAARVAREERLAPVFARAVMLGVPVVDLGPGTGGFVPAIAYEDVERFDLVPRDAGARVARFAEWLRVLAPEDHAARSAVLADVHELARVLRAEQARARRARARAELDRAGREVVQALATVGRAPRTVGAAAGRLVRARFASVDGRVRA
ncbi:MAG: hypothetical protein NVV70_03375 [Cellulomonas sp.]|nr:hypothetical protein [Cellulomonas sp.]MCR6647210.1 hypothetical protein [Cellulomonas sp.]